MWLRDMLPLKIPNARIFTFGYDADTIKLSGVSQLTVNDHGTSLIMDMLGVRRGPEVSGAESALAG
jgi:hypothetical protein